MKFNGKAIYNPSGKAGEYSYWACNFYEGCSNNCTYCYCKKKDIDNTKPIIRECFRNGNIDSEYIDDYDYALFVFEKELLLNIDELRKHGIFFTFSSDPFLDETIDLTFDAIEMCNLYKVPVKLLSKKVPDLFNDYYYNFSKEDAIKSNILFGFSLTGCDELEPCASTSEERINAIKKLNQIGFKTFISLEPIIDIDKSIEMIEKTKDYCDLYKIGLLSNHKYDNENELKDKLLNNVINSNISSKIYLKDSIIKLLNIDRIDLPDNFVNRDYNIFIN